MRKTLASAAVLVAVLAPTGTAHAQHEVVNGVEVTWGDTGNGKGYGNCQNSSSHGIRDYGLYLGGVAAKGAKGNGGHVTDTKERSCTWPTATQVRVGDGESRFS
ncbi:MAG: hypothetical protein M3P93_18420 [Actinomycetota bacterium]|jgi:hypothetical protein|nr:hypothetical protein [Actinomycetota bacterium]